MKKIMALLSAAVMIFTVAGCVNKNGPEPESAVSDEGSALAADSTAQSPSEESAVQEETATVADTTQRQHTRKPTVTLYTTRATSPDHLTSRPTTTERTTITIALPSGTIRETTQRTTRPQVTRTTAAPTLEVITTTRPLPTLNYGGEYSVTDENGTSTVKLVSHLCKESGRGTYEIVFNTQVVRHGSALKHIEIRYDCFDKNGNKLNEKPLTCIAVLGEEGSTGIALATATLDTARVEFYEMG